MRKNAGGKSKMVSEEALSAYNASNLAETAAAQNMHHQSSSKEEPAGGVPGWPG